MMNHVIRGVHVKCSQDGDLDTDLLLRPGRAEDADDVAELFRATYGKTTHPCKNPSFIREGIDRKQQLWFVVDDNSVIRGCICTALHSWNRSWEVCFGIVQPQFRNSGVASRLAHMCLETVCPGSLELGYYTPRLPSVHHIMTKEKDAVLVGHDGGPNMADGSREYHMLAIYPPEKRGFCHVAPLSDPVLRAPFIRHRLYDFLKTQPVPGVYPDVYFTGPPGSERDTLFRFSHDELANAITLSAYLGLGTTASEVAADLDTFIARHPSIHYWGAYVLSDKSELIRGMLQNGFVMTAYLPAWHLHGNARYDCAMLVRHDFPYAPEKHGFDADIEALSHTYAQLADDICHCATQSPVRHVNDVKKLHLETMK